MRKTHALFLAGLGAVTLTGATAAASRDIHTLNVPLPDGATARVEYVGEVAPKVTVTPGPFEPFGLFDRSAFDMERQIDAMMRQVDQMARQPIGRAGGLNVASYGNGPAGGSSVTIVMTSNGTQTCTRRTDVTSEGPGKAPKVVSSFSGNCSPVSATSKVPSPT